MLLMLHILILAALVTLRFRQIDGRISPDGDYYLAALRKPVPRPYHGRRLHVWMTRAVRVFVPWLSPIWAMRIVVAVGIGLCPLATYALAAHLRAAPWGCFIAALAVVMADPVLGSWVMFPWLADPWATALAIFACSTGNPWITLACLSLAGLAKEGAFLVGGAFLVVLDPSLWWVAVIAGCVTAASYFLGSPARPDQDWLKRPFKHAQSRKRREWFDWKKNLSGFKALPWAAAVFLPGTPLAFAALASIGAAWLPTMIAMDHARVLGQCVPFVAAATAVALPPWALAPFALAMTFWPFETEFA